MLKKGRTLALGVVIAGAVGLGAPMANAATMAPKPGSGTGVANGISSQELQNCANAYFSKVVSSSGTSALSGNVVGIQRGTTGWAIITGLLSTSATTATTTTSGTSCGLTKQQVLALYCAGALPMTTTTTTQPQMGLIEAVLALLGQGAVTTTTTTTTSNLDNLCGPSGK